MSDEKYWKIIWKNVQLSARYGAGGGRVRKGEMRGTGQRDVSITLEDIKELWHKQDGRCHWLNIKMSLEDLEIKNSPFAPSVERLDNSLGYVPGNVVLASRFANRGRGAYNADDFYDRLELLLNEARSEDWTSSLKKKSSPYSLFSMKSWGFGHLRLRANQA